MRRNLAEILLSQHEEAGYYPGDQAAHRAAAALADRFDALTIIAITDALAFLERVGGQLATTTLRQRVDFQGRPVAEGEQGEYRTIGLSIDYESRDAKVAELKPRSEVFGIPVTDTSEPPTVIDIERSQTDSDAPPEPAQELPEPVGTE